MTALAPIGGGAIGAASDEQVKTLYAGTARFAGQFIAPPLWAGTARFAGQPIILPLQAGTARFAGQSLAVTTGTARFTGQPLALVLRSGTARFTGQLLLRAAIRPTGNPVRVYRARIQAGAESFRVVPTNWQGTFAADRANYLAISVHNPPDDALAAIAAAAEAEATLTLTLETGWRFASGSAYYSDLMSVNLQVIRDSIGPTSRSARLEGYQEAPVLAPKHITISRTETLRLGGAVGWRGVIDDRVNPGDLVTVADRPGLSFVAGNIVYNIDATRGTMDINQLTDAEILENLPW